MSTEYQIKNLNGIVIGRFQSVLDRDEAFNEYIEHGFKSEEVI